MDRLQRPSDVHSPASCRCQILCLLHKSRSRHWTPANLAAGPCWSLRNVGIVPALGSQHGRHILPSCCFCSGCRHAGCVAAAYQHRGGKPLICLSSSRIHRFQLTWALSVPGLRLGWPVKSALRVTMTLVVLGLSPQSAWQPKGPQAGPSQGTSQTPSPQTGSLYTGFTNLLPKYASTWSALEKVT